MQKQKEYEMKRKEINEGTEELWDLNYEEVKEVLKFPKSKITRFFAQNPNFIGFLLSFKGINQP